MDNANGKESTDPYGRPADGARRRFCQIAIGSTAGLSGAVMAYPAISFLRIPKSLGPVELMEVPLDELTEGEARWGEHRGRQIAVIKLGGKIRAFDGECVHLGCLVRWDSASRMFTCPCHEARYDYLGNPVSGPVNAPLRRVEFVVEENQQAGLPVLKIRDLFGQG